MTQESAVTYSNGVVSGAMAKHVFTIKMILTKNNGSYSLASNTVYFRDESDQTKLVDLVTLATGTGMNTGGNRIRNADSQEIYQLPKTKNRKPKEYKNRTLSIRK